jgi:hypothetical protein
MPDIKETITRPIGPLPAYAWVLVIVGGYFGYKFLSGRSGSSSTTATTSTGGSGIPADNSSYVQTIQDLINRIPVPTSPVTIPPIDIPVSIPPINNPISGPTPISNPTPPYTGGTVVTAPVTVVTAPVDPAPALWGFWTNNLGQTVDNLGTVYNVIAGSNNAPGENSAISDAGVQGRYSTGASPFAALGTEPIFTLSNGIILRPMYNENAVSWWKEYITNRASAIGSVALQTLGPIAPAPQFSDNTATPTPTANAANVASGTLANAVQSIPDAPSLPTYSMAQIPSQSLNIPATTPS